MAYTYVTVPSGEKITMGSDGKLNVPDNPIIPFIEGDGTGVDIWKASVRVFDAAVEKAYGGRRKSAGWKCMPVKNRSTCFAMKMGDKAWLPDETVAGIQGVSGRHQRAADHSDWWRYSLSECCASSVA